MQRPVLHYLAMAMLAACIPSTQVDTPAILPAAAPPAVRDNMEAVRIHHFGEPDVLRLERATPVPGSGELLVRVHAAV
jgi:hypothetical protein